MPKVSVLISTFNRTDYLRMALDSALAQDYPDFEIVILDDGSTDNTADVISEYSDPRIHYHWQPNQGVARTYNRLMELGEGEYFHHLDNDDILMPGALTTMAALLDANPSAGIAYGEAPVIDSIGRIYSHRRVPKNLAAKGLVPSVVAFKELLSGCHITTSTVMMRRSVLYRVAPFQPEAVPGEDWDFWLRIAAEFDVVCTPQSIAYYRIHSNSITGAYNVEKVLASHEFALGKIFADPAFKHNHLKGYAYACLERTLALVAARGRRRFDVGNHLVRALLRRPGFAFERETLGVLYEGAKSLLPADLIAIGRKMRRGFKASVIV
jgi:glycosyltransferase involved in cell wall biosynthesis